MEVTLTLTPRRQSSSLTVSYFLPTRSWGRRVCTRTLPAAAEHVLSDYDIRTNSRTSIFPLGRKEGMGFLCALGLFLSIEHGDGAGSGSELGQPGQ